MLSFRWNSVVNFYALSKCVDLRIIASYLYRNNFQLKRAIMMRKISNSLPPLTEQAQIVSELERHLSAADKAEATIDAELKRAERLRQSILKHAFSGKLVPQDPNDEPASVLLKQIKEEKSRQQSEQKKRTTKAKATPSAKQLSLPLD